MRNFLVLGRTGVGKSSLINSTFGADLAPTSAYEACTQLPRYYSENTPFGEICLIDTPGLAEKDEQLDEHYLSLVSHEIKSTRVDAILYVTRLDDTRFRPEEKRSIALMTEKIGSFIWECAWIIFTFAGSVPKEKRQEFYLCRLQKIESFIDEIQKSYGFEFDGFEKIILIDNVKQNWTDNGEPISNLFSK